MSLLCVLLSSFTFVLETVVKMAQSDQFPKGGPVQVSGCDEIMKNTYYVPKMYTISEAAGAEGKTDDVFQVIKV